MVFNVSETKGDGSGEPTDPNKVRVALSFLFDSSGTLNFEDAPVTVDFNGDHLIDFVDESNNTIAYIPAGTDGDITSGGGAVDSVFGRTGDVSAKDGDYSLGQIAKTDLQALLEDTISNQPAAGTANRWYHATDENIIYRDDGSSWGAIGGTGSEGSPVPGTSHFEATRTTQQNIGPKTVTASDSPYTTQGESRIAVDSSTGTVTVTLASADAVDGRQLKIVDSGGSAGSNTITIQVEGANGEVINPGGQTSITVTLNGGYAEIENIGGDWYSDRNRESEMVRTGQADITNESFVRAPRTTDNTGIASGTYVDIPDSEAKDARGELDANYHFTPDESGEYDIGIRVNLNNGGTADLIGVRVYNVTDGVQNVLSQLEEDVNSYARIPTFNTIELTAGKEYAFQVRDNTSTVDLVAADTAVMVRRSVVHS